MPKKFKDYYGKETAEILAKKLKSVFPKFSDKSFIKEITEKTKPLEFLARQDVYVECFDKYLPKEYEKKIKIFSKILGSELKTEAGMFTYGFWLWPIGRYLEKNADKHQPQDSLNFIYELTKRFTGEFAIRNLLKKYPKKVLKVMQKWSKDKNVHVRRLSSEGIRIKLPWAKKLNVFLENPHECLVILNNLKNAKEKFVQKSVANNLNDLGKENPKLFKEIINKWQKENPSKETLWIIKHGSRTFRKKQSKT